MNTAGVTLMELLLNHPSALFVSVIIVLGQEMANHSSILAWKIPRTGEPWGLQSVEVQRVDRPE